MPSTGKMTELHGLCKLLSLAPARKYIGGRVSRVVLAESSPIFLSNNGEVGPCAVDMIAKQIRQGMESEFGKAGRLSIPTMQV